MAKRFTDTEIWNEDWFCNLPSKYQFFWFFVKDNCDHAGVWKPNKINFEIKTKLKIDLKDFFEKVNQEKERVIILKNDRWFLTGFIKFQWFEKKQNFDLTLSNTLHKSIFESLIKNEIDLTSVRGLKEVLQTSKEKVKEMDKEKEKEKEKDKKEDKGMDEKSKKDKNQLALLPTYLQDEDFEKTFNEYLEMRKKIGKPATNRAKELTINKLDKLARGDLALAIAILEQSIFNSYQGVFPLKEEGRIQSYSTKSKQTRKEKFDDALRELEDNPIA